MEFVFLSIFVASYLAVYNARSARVGVVALIIGILSASVALYYKETAAAMVLTFGAAHLILRKWSDFRGDSSLGNHSRNPSAPLHCGARQSAPHSQGETIAQSNTANTRIVLDSSPDSSSSLRGNAEVIHKIQTAESANFAQKTQMTNKETARSAALPPFAEKAAAFSGQGGAGRGEYPFLREKETLESPRKAIISDSVKQILNKIFFRKDTSALPQYDEKSADLESSKMDCHETRCVSRNDTHPLAFGAGGSKSANEGESQAQHTKDAFAKNPTQRALIKIFDIALILTSLAWYAVYYLVVLREKSQSGFYGDSPYNQLLVMVKILFSYALNEPFLFIALPLLLLYRVYRVVFRRDRIYALLDSAALAGVILILEYVVLRLGDVHYVLPAYIFGIIALCGFGAMYVATKWLKGLYGICLVIFLSNALPFSVYEFCFYKFVPNNFQKTLGFVSEYVRAQGEARIYLEGVNRASGVEVYHSFGKWLKAYRAGDFDLFSDLPIDNTLLGKENPKSAYSVFQSNAITPKQRGDLVIITPYSTRLFDKQNLDSQYELLFVGDFGANVPNFSVKALLKYALLKTRLKDSEAILGQNAFGLPLHFYVYRVR